jgi:deoxyribodipyrimidine photolyase-related protein
MQEAVLIYPHQLFKDNQVLDKKKIIILIEEELFFRQYNFHVQKLIFHRATMKNYEQYLQKEGYKTIYLESHKFLNTEDIFIFLKKQNISKISVLDVTDFWLEKRIIKYSAKYKIDLKFQDTPQFYLTKQEVNEWLLKNPKPKMQFFYKFMRKKLHILMTDNGAPEGGEYSYDKENRKKIPKNLNIPRVNVFIFDSDKKLIEDAKIYVKKHFGSNIGSLDGFNYAISFDGAEKALSDFLENRFSLFGPYEDAIKENESYLFHSVLSAYINVGLLTPKYVVSQTVTFAKENNIKIASLEGFVRQIIGWREFMRVMYVGYGVKMRQSNFFNHKNKLPLSFWQGDVGVMPVDCVIKKVLQSAYCHHIERLMIIGNFMVLKEYDPNDCYLWFMEMFIDAYDWVMVPNVYGMSQFADGGIFATKPYISSSAYILKMSDFKSGDWADEWSNLFWRFLFKHEEFFKKQPRMNMLIRANGDKRSSYIS